MHINAFEYIKRSVVDLVSFTDLLKFNHVLKVTIFYGTNIPFICEKLRLWSNLRLPVYQRRYCFPASGPQRFPCQGFRISKDTKNSLALAQFIGKRSVALSALGEVVTVDAHEHIEQDDQGNTGKPEQNEQYHTGY